MASPSEQEPAADIPLEQIVFSCGSCQATIPELYATKESNQGFHSGSSDKNGIVTKLWIAECSHIFCSKHLPDGAPPFHPGDEPPQAPCPQCIEKGDKSRRALYGLRGLGAGDMDTVIPPDWIMCPAIKLDGTVPGMEAVRFQYVNISRYAQHVRRHWKLAERQQHAMEAAYSAERKQRRQVEQELNELKARVVGLEGIEAKLQKWEGRKPIINHYLGVIHPMSSEIQSVRSQLKQLGYRVSDRSYAFNPHAEARSSNEAITTQSQQHPAKGKAFSSSSTAGEFELHIALAMTDQASSRILKPFVFLQKAQARWICT